MLRKYTSLILLICALSFAGIPARAQSHEEKLDIATIDKIKDEGMKHSDVMNILSYLCDVYGPRLTGSPYVKEAQEWAMSQLKSWGLQNVHLESWGPFGRGWTLQGFTANVDAPHYYPMIAYPKAWSPSTDGTLKGEPVYLDAKTPADLEKYRGKLKGAIVLLSGAQEVKAHFEAQGTRLDADALLKMADAQEPRAGGGRRFEPTAEMKARMELDYAKWKLCYEEGAGVVLEPGRGDGGTIFVAQVTIPAAPDTPFDKRPRPWGTDAPKIVPQVAVAVEHYNRLIRMIERGVHPTLEINIQSKFNDGDPMSYNVVGEIPGTDLKDQVVMLGGHFDSWQSGTGATDNGAGSAVALEAVRILASLGIKPRRTIRVALWTGEEEGLLGSRAYVAQHFGERVYAPGESMFSPGSESKPPKYELKPDQAKISGYFNLDNGTGKIRGVYLQGNGEIASLFREWLAPFHDMGASTLTLENTGGTDHLSFDAVGIPGFQFIQDPIEYGTRTHHSNMDLYDRIQEDDMKQASVIMASFVYNTAMRDEMLPRKVMPGMSAPAAGK